MAKLKAVIIGAGRMGGTIDDEVRDYRPISLPYSHAAGYAASPDVELVAFADTDEAKCKSLQERYEVPRGYTDYREMIDREKPHIVSITTPGTSHAELTVFAAEHGAKGIYCEKAFACSLREADAMVEAVESNGVKFNMGTLRRWSTGAAAMKEFIASGRIGSTQAVISYSCGSLLHSSSHFLDLLLYLADDAPVEWVQGTVINADFDPEADRSDVDLAAVGCFQFESGVRGHLMDTSLWAQHEIICQKGALRTRNDCAQWDAWETGELHGHRHISAIEAPTFEEESSTTRLIRDLVNAVETDGETAQGVRAAAMSAELAFGFVESSRQGGARVPLPVANRDFYMFTH